MRSTILLVAVVLAGCDTERKDNPLDPESAAFRPPVVVSEVRPEGAGTISVSQGAPGWLDLSLQATPAEGWYFHHWLGRSLTGMTDPAVSMSAREAGDTVRLEARFLPNWTLTDSTLIDDFDVPDLFSSTGRHNSDLLSTLQDAGVPFGSSGWAAQGSAKSRFHPENLKARESGDGDWRPTRVPSGGWNGGQCQHLSVARPRGEWAVVTTALKPWPTPVDLSSLRMIRFWAKGLGRIMIGFVTVQGMNNGDYAIIQSRPILLSGQWKQYEVDPSSLVAPDWSSLGGETWENHKSALINLHIEIASDSVDLWLDDIWLVGTPFSSLL